MFDPSQLRRLPLLYLPGEPLHPGDLRPLSPALAEQWPAWTRLLVVALGPILKKDAAGAALMLYGTEAMITAQRGVYGLARRRVLSRLHTPRHASALIVVLPEEPSHDLHRCQRHLSCVPEPL